MRNPLLSDLMLTEYDGKIPDAWAAAYMRLFYSDAAQDMKADAWALWKCWGARILDNGWTPADLRKLFPLIKGRTVTAVGIGDVTFDDGDKAFRRPTMEGPSNWQAGRRSA